MTMLHDSRVHCWFNTEMDYIWDFARVEIEVKNYVLAIIKKYLKQPFFFKTKAI